MSNVNLPDGWMSVKLKDVAAIQTGLAKGKRNIKDPVRLPYLRVANVQDGYLDLSEIKEIEVERADVQRYLLQEGDVLLTEGGDYDKLGRGDLWRGQLPICLHQNHVFAVRTNREVLDPYFLSSLAGSSYGKRYFLECSKQSTNLASINSTQLKNFPIILPPLEEQRAIGRFLQKWDNAIALTKHLIAAKQQRRKGLMQQLLTGKWRFKEFEGQVWCEFQLGEFLTLKLRKVPKPSTSYWALGVRSHGRGTFTREVDNPSKIAMTNLYEVKAGDLIVNITFAWEGAIALVKESNEGCLVSHRFPTYVFNRRKVDPDFFKYLMVTKRFFYELGVISPGGAGRNRVLSKKDFLRIKVKLPPLEEQRRYAEVLCCADREINLLRQKLDALQRQKEGLMQRLLTGQVRVKM
jgi:type I restriction enzyme S subunit